MLSAKSRRLIEIVHGPQTKEQWEEIERDVKRFEEFMEAFNAHRAKPAQHNDKV